MNKPILLGGALIAGYYLFYRNRGKAVASPGPKPRTKPGSFYLPQLVTSGGLSPGEKILSDPSQLEGYFSTGNAPCCRNCANGRPCVS